MGVNEHSSPCAPFSTACSVHLRVKFAGDGDVYCVLNRIRAVISLARVRCAYVDDVT